MSVVPAEPYVRLVLIMAASFQGGHCKTGGEVADLLGIPFPLTMRNLSAAAVERGFDPDQLWPWLTKMLREREIAESASAEVPE